MIAELFLIFASAFFAFSLVSKRVQGTPITPPLLFTVAGLVLGSTILSMGVSSFSESTIHTLAEITLILVLSADASRISLKKLRQFKAVPVRLLIIALPLIIAFGAVVGHLVLPGFGWVEAALVAAILAPTDAALGTAVLADKSVPLRIRQGLNVESGLNDGIALPAVLFFACMLNMNHQTGDENWLIFLSLQLTLGPLAGILIGWLGGNLIGMAASREWITPTFQGVAALALAVVAFAIAEMVGGNGFIAAFVAGIVYGNLHVTYSSFLHKFTETESEFLSLLTFFLFGIAILPEALAHATWPIVGYALLSLTIVRMVPVALSMIGLRLRLPTLGFLGWFGPRGLASLLFALLVLEDLEVAQAASIQSVVTITVLASILLHGLSASTLSAMYGAWSARGTTPTCPENNPVVVHERIKFG